MSSMPLANGLSTSVNKKKLSKRMAKENNQYKEFPLLNLYILIVIVLEIIGEAFNVGILRLLKPFPIIMMIMYISGKNSQRDHLVPTLVRAGLAVSLVGDILLMINELSAFIIGTGFFLIAHILYCIAFCLGERVRDSTGLNKLLRIILCFGLTVLFVFNNYTLWDLFPNRLLFPLYGFILLLMNIFSINRYEKTTPYSYWFMAIGAVLFGLSDNLLAMLKFNGMSTDFGRAAVMILYYGAQYLLMHGAMHHSNLLYQIERHRKTNGMASGNIRVETGSKKKRRGDNPRWEGESDQEHDD